MLEMFFPIIPVGGIKRMALSTAGIMQQQILISALCVRGTMSV